MNKYRLFLVLLASLVPLCGTRAQAGQVAPAQHGPINRIMDDGLAR